MYLDSLTPGGLYIILFIRGDPPSMNDFHWGLYLHHDSNYGGTKYHIKKEGSSGWITDHGHTRGVFKSFLLVGLFQIATVPQGRESHVDEKIRSYDPSINTPGVTCRVWVLWVLALLQQPANGYTVLRCNNLNELEEEIKQWGNANAQSAADNGQPRPIGYSSKIHCPNIKIFAYWPLGFL
ncbi:hypothetical protein K505DRAFT_252705 [Melanomma pulvis-pyrius CBS 109.77]|uniref:Uncharacterized protein n=1 Tax=Melanomma pulvis-pyrius CBS 109.77 TaxID=1314802 RepID=A0A6A6X049_9PLEO|nr:hypothetical protein K505DRAFT_252705 [Melanomma pulvis-pyrius CBS 109.77]